MKQHITKKQWNELTIEQKTRLIGDFSMPFPEVDTYPPFTIGQMIEFLNMEHTITSAAEMGWFDDLSIPDGDTLCDQLWNAVKYKLNQ